MRKFALFAIVFTTFLMAEKADVIDAKIKKSYGGSYVAYVKIKHNDVDASHFADEWEILDENGKRITVRLIFGPQPGKEIIDSELYGFKIPKGTKKIIIRAHCSKDGFGGKEFEIDLPLEKETK